MALAMSVSFGSGYHIRTTGGCLVRTKCYHAAEGYKKSLAEQTLEMLEWPRLSESVARCACTTLAKKKLEVLHLPLTRNGSDLLLSETQAALQFSGLHGGTFDLATIQTEVVKDGLDRASRSVAISGQEAVAIVSMLESCRAIRRAILSASEVHNDKQRILQPLTDMFIPLSIDSEIVKSIRSTVNDDGSVKDSASPELKKAKLEEYASEKKLQEMLQRLLSDKLSGDINAQVTTIEGRLCLGLSTDNCQKVPGLLLGSGSSGLVTYVEPSVSVALNNTLLQARAEVIQAEYRVLYALTTKLNPFLDDFKLVLDVIVDFDVVMARANYSSAIGATYPMLTSIDAGKLETHTGSTLERFLICLEGAKHPLLLQQHTETLREAKAKANTEKKALQRLKSRAAFSADLTTSERSLAEAEAKVAALETSAPVPISFLVKKTTKVVTITGPNTGGKTAAIKTLGLAALMARAGLYVLAKEPAHLPWVDLVLADIGDQQSLSQSLSTFSGHLQRIKFIRAEATSNSLVLLDEIGTGTDIVEGAALGMSILEAFAGSALLTLATTHHGALKMLKYSDKRFENASVEFDEENLKPTYKLLWGIPGRSHALNIASKLGLPEEIISTARDIHGSANAELNEVIMEIEQARQKFEKDFEECEKLLVESRKMYEALEKAAAQVKKHKDSLELDKADHIAFAERFARSSLDKIVRDLRSRLN